MKGNPHHTHLTSNHFLTRGELSKKMKERVFSNVLPLPGSSFGTLFGAMV